MNFEENLEHNFDGDFEVEHEYVGGFEIELEYVGGFEVEHEYVSEFEVENEYVGGFEVDWSWLVMSDKVANPPPWLPIAHRNNRNDEDGE